MNRHKLKLSQISLETFFREKERNENLELSIASNGLRFPLVVEEVNENNYVLVDGYRRYYALKFIGKKEAECTVEKLTSPEGRLLKRLAIEFHTEKRNPYQLERMINQLLAIKNYDIKEIAELCSVTVDTVKKYIKGREINPEWIRVGEEKELGRHVLTDIYYLNNISYKTKECIFKLYSEKEITGTAVKNIELITRIPGFKSFPEKVKKECIDEVIQFGIKDKEMMDEIVSKKSLQSNFNAESHKFLENQLIKLINRIKKILLSTNFVNKMPLNKKLFWKKEFEGLIMLLNITDYKSEFRNADNSILKDENDSSSGDNLEH